MATYRCQECDREFDLNGKAPGDEVRCPHCSGMAAEIDDDRTLDSHSPPGSVSGPEKEQKIRPGDVLRGFRVEQLIATGGMAAVYKATQLSLNRPVALKILPTRYAHNPTFVQQFDAETEVLASLNQPHIISIIDRGHEAETYFFAMEFVDGTTLRGLMQSGRITPAFFVKIFGQCAEALRYAHARGVIHRDIKPANIMLDEDSNVKVADFGLAGIIAKGEETGKPDSPVMGTPGFMSPEQMRSMSLTDERSDIFSLGAVMYQALTGSVPAELPPPAPSELNDEADPRLDPLVLKCLKRHPEDRFQNAQDLLDALDAYRHDLTHVGEVCPKCKAENPIAEKTCLKCGADMSDLFDICPECRTENRRDVEQCLGCGAKLKDLRAQVAVLISKRREKARALAKEERYGDAIKVLERVLQARGKLFEYARRQAIELIGEYKALLRAQGREALAHGRTVAAEGQLAQAVRLWKKIPIDVLDDADVAGLIRKTEEKMAECRARVKRASALLDERRCAEAASLLREAAAAWPQCPGLTEARYQLQALEQTEELIQNELKEVDRLLAQEDYAGASKALSFASASLPEHPRVRQKLQEIELKEKQGSLAGLVEQAMAFQDEGQYEMASRSWEKAAALFDDSNPRKAQFIENAEAARQLAASGGGASAPVAQEEQEGEPAVHIRQVARPRGTRVLLIALAIMIAAVIVGLAVVLVVRHRPGTGTHEPGQDSHLIGQPPDEPPVGQGDSTSPDAPPTDQFFREDFDTGDAPNWQLEEPWRISLAQRRALRALSDDSETVAVHKYYREQDCGVEMWVRVDAASAGSSARPAVAVAVRQNGDDEIVLRITDEGDGFKAQISAVTAGRPVAQTRAISLPQRTASPFEGKVRIDASGDQVAASVDGVFVGVLRELPSQLTRAGQVALRSAYCRSSWDDVVLGRVSTANIPEKDKPVEPPPPPPTRLPPVRSARSAPGTEAVALNDYSFAITQSFSSDAAGWEAAAGAWRVGGGQYEVTPGRGGTSFSSMGQFADVELMGQVGPGAIEGASDGKQFGLYARYADERNYVFFGLAGAGGKGWQVALATCRAGHEEVLTVPGGPYALADREKLDLKLTVVGEEACGYLGDTPLLSVKNLPARAPARGRAGIVADGLAVSFDSLSIRADSVDLDVPDGVEAQRAEGSGVIQLKECGVKYVLLKGLVTRECSMTVHVRLGSMERYPQFAVCGAARDERGAVAAAVMDLDARGAALIRFAGKVEYRDELLPVTYGSKSLPRVDLAQPQRMTLVIRGNELVFMLNGEPIFTHSEAAPPLPAEPGRWGFRSMGMEATIERVEIEM